MSSYTTIIFCCFVLLLKFGDKTLLNEKESVSKMEWMEIAWNMNGKENVLQCILMCTLVSRYTYINYRKIGND